MLNNLLKLILNAVVSVHSKKEPKSRAENDKHYSNDRGWHHMNLTCLLASTKM